MNIPDERVLVCFALREEARPFEALAAQWPKVRVLVTGMGRSRAGRAVGEALQASTPDCVLTCGFAGGLNPELARGDVICAAEGAGGWRDRLRAAGARPAVFHSADRIAATAEEKRQLRLITGADAVEMESAAIQAECRRRGVVCAIVRVISDAAGEDLPVDFNRFLGPDLRLQWSRLLGTVLRSPARMRGMIELRRATRGAATRLARVLAAAIMAGGPSSRPSPGLREGGGGS